MPKINNFMEMMSVLGEEGYDDNESILRDCTEEVRDNDDCVIEACMSGGLETSMQWASERLRNDRDFALRLFRYYHVGDELRWFSLAIRDDEEVIDTVARLSGWNLKWASDRLKSDRDYVVRLINIRGGSLRFASETLRSDRELALMALHSYDPNHVYSCLSDELKNDREIIIESAKYDDYAWLLLKDTHNDDREVVELVVHRKGRRFKDVSDRLRNDREIAIMAITEDDSAFLWVGDDLYHDEYINFLARRYIREEYYEDIKWIKKN